MVDLMGLLSDALIGSFQMLMLNDLGKNMFPYRIKTCWKRILIYGVTALVILGVNHIESTFINIMMVPVSYTIAAIVIFQGSVWKKIILACCYYMLAIVPEFLFAVITGAYGVTGTENNFHSELEKLLSLLLMSTITFLLVKCVNQITRKKNYQTIENKLFTVLLTLPAATIIIFMCIYYSHISFTGVNRIMIPIGAALLLMTNICIFAVFDKLIEKSEEVKKMELLYQKSKAENINQKYINKVNEDKRVFLHDVNKFLCTAASLIENGKNLELDSMVRHLGIRMEELKNYSYCSDPVLNSILCERKFVAESKGILYKIKLGNNIRTDFIEDLDLISIVGNLLDNAIEAAEKTKKDQHVICNMYMGNEGHLLVMEFYNKKDSINVPQITFRDYLSAERKLKESERYVNDKRYWEKRIAYLPDAPELPTLSAEDVKKNFTRKLLCLDSERWNSFKDAAKKLGITPSTAILTAYSDVIAKWSYNKSFCINLTVLNRFPLHDDVTDIVGDFTTLNLLEINANDGNNFAERARKINERLFIDLDHRLFGGVEVIRELSKQRNKRVFMPIVYTSAIGLADQNRQITGKFDGGITQTPQVFIDCQAMDGDFGLQINWDVREGVFPDGMIDDMFDLFQQRICHY